jgi:hypothetical protein
MRLLNICVLVLLVAAAAFVYEIKFESTLRGERVAKMRGDVQRERDAIAALRAEWATLDNPARIQALVRRHLALVPIEASQYDSFDSLPERPPVIVQPPPGDSIATVIDYFNPKEGGPKAADHSLTTGSVPAQSGKR